MVNLARCIQRALYRSSVIRYLKPGALLLPFDIIAVVIVSSLSFSRVFFINAFQKLQTASSPVFRVSTGSNVIEKRLCLRGEANADRSISCSLIRVGHPTGRSLYISFEESGITSGHPEIHNPIWFYRSTRGESLCFRFFRVPREFGSRMV